MAIIKIIKRDCPYVTIDKTGVDDPNLSWAATGLLTYLIGRPGNWKINITHLSTVKTCKETATKSALKELREANYCHYFVVRKNGKISETFYLVFEVPTNYEEVLENYIDLKDGETILYQPVKIEKNTENKTKKKVPQVENQLIEKRTGNKEVLPQVENPLVENLLVENQGLLIKDTTNNRITNNKTTTSESKRSSSSLKENNLRIAVTSGLANTRRLIDSIEAGEKHYDFVEIMACPGGCVGGGGQPIHESGELAVKRGSNLYFIDKNSKVRYSHENECIKALYNDFFEKPNSHKAHSLLHTDHFIWEMPRSPKRDRKGYVINEKFQS